MKTLITGGNGYIAKSLASRLGNTLSITRKDFDLTDKESTSNWFKDKYFDVIIHTAVVGGSRLKKDNGDTFYQNIQMFYNLLNSKHCFGKLIHFGSGAELNMPSDPYGLSKKIIWDIIKNEPNFYNIRIFGVFNENELDTRFIKNNIKRYINKQSIEIHQNKLMDFFYMEDLIKLIKYYTTEKHPPKNVDCSYSYHYNLIAIANMINELSDYKVEIKIKSPVTTKSYIGKENPINIKWKGLKQGIKETYKKLLNETN